MCINCLRINRLHKAWFRKTWIQALLDQWALLDYRCTRRLRPFFQDSRISLMPSAHPGDSTQSRGSLPPSGPLVTLRETSWKSSSSPSAWRSPQCGASQWGTPWSRTASGWGSLRLSWIPWGSGWRTGSYFGSSWRPSGHPIWGGSKKAPPLSKPASDKNIFFATQIMMIRLPGLGRRWSPDDFVPSNKKPTSLHGSQEQSQERLGWWWWWWWWWWWRWASSS